MAVEGQGLTREGLLSLYAWFLAVDDFGGAALCAEILLSANDGQES